MVTSSTTTFLLWVGYAAAIGLAASMATYALSRRDNRVARAFGGVMVALLVWAFGAFGRLLVPTRTAWHALTVVMYLGVATTPVLFVVFVAAYSGRGPRLTRRRVAALFVVPAGTVLAVATYPAHGLFFASIRTASFAGGEVPFATSGPLFAVHAAYSYLLLVVGTLLLLAFAIETRHGYRRQSIAILVGALIPLGTNAVHVLGFGPSIPADPTPVGFAVGGVALAYAVFGAGVTNLTPVARSAVVDAIDEAVFVVDREDELVDLNPAARRLLEVADPIGEPVSEVVPDPLLPAGEEPRAITVDGSRRWFRVREVDLADQGAVLLAADLTEQVRTERQLRDQNERLEQFTRVAAHDLRNPLNAISGYTDLAMETGDVSHLEDVEPPIDRIETLIEDLLTLGTQGRVVEETVPVSLSAVAERAWAEVGADEATLEVDGDQHLLADERRFTQLLENLFTNAVTYAGDDVTVTVGASEDGFFVADDGTGIPTDDRAEVFEYGYSTHGGTGLGLPVVRSIAVAHGWDVAVTEADDGGARFEFTGIETDPDPFDGLGSTDVARSPFER